VVYRPQVIFGSRFAQQFQRFLRKGVLLSSPRPTPGSASPVPEEQQEERSDPPGLSPAQWPVQPPEERSDPPEQRSDLQAREPPEERRQAA